MNSEGTQLCGIHVSMLPQILLPSRLPYDIEQSSLWYRAGPNCPGSVKPLDGQGGPCGAEKFYPRSPKLLVENYTCAGGDLQGQAGNSSGHRDLTGGSEASKT